jgi:DNA polymerase (family 10)
MPRSNEAVRAMLDEYADLIAISGGDRFKARSYDKAARAVAGHHADVSTLDLAGLLAIPNVGKSIAPKVVEFLATGTVKSLDDLRAEIPSGVRDMMSIPSLGPKKALLLYRERGIASIDDLEAAAQAGDLEGLKGFGARTGENVLAGIALLRQTGSRTLLDAATQLAEDLVDVLSGVEGVVRCEPAGSLRRMAETVGDLDILVATDAPEPVMEAVRELAGVERVLASGPTKTSVRASGMQVDVRVVAPGVWGAALQYFTGSKAHNIRIREMAVRRRLKLSEYGLFDAENGDLIVAETEEEVYARLGLPWIRPELREDGGEVEAALRGELPPVVAVSDLRGDLHTHTDLTDGLAPLEEMVGAASRRGYEYLAITDHAPDLPMQRMTDAKMLAQRERLRALRTSGMTVLHGAELNIDPDGEVDWGPEFLAGFDVLVASVHSHFGQSREEMTRRIVRACENPYVNVIGHPTGRKLGHRAPVDVDLEAVFEAAARTGTALEVNGHPDRLDLRDEHVRWATRHGVKFAVDTDSHAVGHLAHARFGAGTAARGWARPEDVVTTWPLDRLREFLRKGRS